MNAYEPVGKERWAGPGQLLKHHRDPKKWLLRLKIGRKADGKQATFAKVFLGTFREAKAELVRLSQQKSEARLVARTDLRINELVVDWLNIKRSLEGVSARTVKGYEDALRTYVLPVLGDRRVSSIQLRDIQRLYSAMRAGTLPDEVRKAGWRGEPLGARTVQITHTALNQAFRMAVQQGLIVQNPVSLATVGAERTQPKRALTAEERLRFLVLADEQRSFYRLFHQMLMDTGIRPGEACAVTWQDLDLAGGRLTIARTITRGPGGRPVLAPPKTAASRRVIPLFGLQDALLRHCEQQKRLGLDQTGHVFTNQLGGILTPWNFSQTELKRLMKGIGVEPFSLYSFRHTFATLQLHSGTPTKVVSEWLGHSTIQQTANTYQHLNSDIAMDYAERYVKWLAEETDRAEPQLAN